MQVLIFQSGNSWTLQISRAMPRRWRPADIQVLRLFTVHKLIEALDLASQLQLHVDNIQELPLTQYASQGNETGVNYYVIT